MADSLDDIMDDLVYHIKDEKCVLFVGPDVVQVEGISLSQAISNYLKSQSNPGEIIQDNQRDGFFLFNDNVAKTKARTKFSRFFEKNIIDDSVFKLILEIPFHLVVSINADTLLDDTAYKYGVRHKFSYFKNYSKATDEVDTPSSATPLFYNLFGKKSDFESLMLDHEDLYKLFQSSLGAPGLPQKLREELNEAATFLFLGFQFEKWHTQLLIRLLHGERSDSISSKVLSNHFPDEDTKVFLIKEFNIDFLGNEMDFFIKLRQRCEEEKILRRLGNPLDEDAIRITRFVQNNQLDKALEMLNNLCEKMKNDDLTNAATLLLSNYTKWCDDNEKGIIDSRDSSVNRNKIVDSIIKLTNQVKLP